MNKRRRFKAKRQRRKVRRTMAILHVDRVNARSFLAAVNTRIDHSVAMLKQVKRMAHAVSFGYSPGGLRS